MNDARANPFVGPRALEPGEPLFGRSDEIVQLAKLLVSEKIVLFYSPSSAGKTSLLQAALSQRLATDGFQVADHLLRINLPPPKWATQILKFNRFSFSVLSSLDESLPAEDQTPAKELAGMRLTDYLSYRVDPRTVLLFDQFEEVLTIDPIELEVKRAFFRELGDALTDNSTRALFALREEHLAGLDPYLASIPTRFQNRFRLPYLALPAAKEAIQKTADTADMQLSEEVADQLVRELAAVRVQNDRGQIEERAGETLEPIHLQIVCRNLWPTLASDEAVMPEGKLELFGDIDGSLGVFYAAEVGEIASTTGVNERRIRLWIRHNLLGANDLRKSYRMDKKDSNALEAEVVDALVNRHLLRCELRHGAVWLELVHDRLVRPIRMDNEAWIDGNLNLLHKQAALWDRHGRPASLLLTGADLQASLDWARAHPEDTLPSEDAFLDASIEREAESKAQMEEDKALAIAKQQALFQHQRAEALKQRNQVIAGLSVLALILASVGVFLGWSASVNAERANAAGTQTVAQQSTAEQAQGLAEMARATAEAASTEAKDQRAAAEAAGTEMAEAQQAANAAGTQLADQQQNAQEAQAAAESARETAAAARAEVEIQLTINRANYLAGQGLHSLEEDEARALLLGIEAVNLADTGQARSALLTALQRNLDRRVVQNGPLIPLPQYGDVAAIGYSPDGQIVALGTLSGDVLLWEPAEGGSPEPFVRHQRQVLSAAFHPDGEILATGDRNRTILLWDLQTGEPIVQLPANDWVLSLAFSPDGRMLASGGTGRDRRVLIWDVEDPENPGLLAQLNEPQDAVRTVAWSPDGQQIAAGEFASGFGIRRLWVWDVSTGQPLREIRVDSNPIWSVAWSPDGRFLASGDEDGNLVLWDYGSGQKLADLPKIDTTQMIALTFTPGGEALIGVHGGGLLAIWEVAAQKLLLQAQTTPAAAAAFSPNLDRMVLGSAADNVTLWNLALDQPLRVPLAQLEGAVQSLAYDDDQTLLATAINNQRASVWRIAAGDSQEVLSVSGIYESSAVSPAGGLVAVGGEDGSIVLQDFVTGEYFQQFGKSGDSIQSLAFDPEGKFLAVGSSTGEASIWERAENGSAFSLFASPVRNQENQGGVTALAVGLDVPGLVSGFENGSLHLWRLSGEDQEGHLAWFAQRTGISSLAVSPDGRLLATGGIDQTVRLWDLETRQQIGGPLAGAESAVTSLVFHPSGLQLIAGEAGGVIAVWELDPALWVARACELAGRNLTAEEWAFYFPGEAYRETCPDNS